MEEKTMKVKTHLRVAGKGIARCSLGHTGLVLGRKEITYPDGERAVAYVGRHLLPIRLLGRRWSSRSPRWLIGAPLPKNGRSRPCPATVEGPFLAIRSESPVTLCCAHSEGHNGPHFIKVEWTQDTPDA